MDFFDELNRSISGVSRVGNLKSLIRDEQKRINDLYVEIGTRYFESNKNDPNALYASQIAQIKVSLERIDGYNQQIYMTRGAAPVRPVCTKCGNPLAPSDQFCAICGTRAGAGQPAGNLCSKCGAVVAQGSAFCSVCGAQQTTPQPEATVICTACGATLKADVAFCMVCGAKVGAEETPAPDTESVTEEVVEAEISSSVAEAEPEVQIEIIEQTEETITEPESAAQEIGELQIVDVSVEEDDTPAETEVVNETVIAEAPVQEVFCEEQAKESENVNPYENMISENICRVCGKEVSPTAKFCIFCGTKR